MRIPHFPLFPFLVFLTALGLAGSAWSEPVITEFMADNESTVQDEDGDYSDFIEIHNPTAANLDLNNWCLTDNANDLSKWRFPAVTLPPGGFLIVWASGKDKRVPGQPLHTSFGLSAGGEYLALVRPDGTTVQQQFAPEYPPLEADESYGLQFTSTTLLAEGASAKYLIPTSGALGLNWTSRNFDDTTWANATTGIGFGLLVPGINVRHVLKNTAFGTVDSIATADALLNAAPGSSIVASEATVTAPTVNFLGEGSDGHYGSNQIFPISSGEPFAIKATGSISIPSAGTYTFGLNSDDGGRIRIDGNNVMVDDTNHGAVDHVGTVSLTAGLHSFEVIMWEAGGGDEVEFYGAAGSFASWNSNMKLVGDTASGGLAAFTLPSGGGSSVIATNIEGPMRNQNATGYFRVRFPASNASSLTALSLKMRFNDGYAAFLNGVPITSENAPGTLAYNSAATATRTDEQSLVPSSSNATALIPQIVDGTNVLAIQGLNISAADGSFLVLPELVGGVLNSAADPVFFHREKATPGAINGDYSVLGKVADTKFSVDRGYFTAPFSLAITTTTPGATIRYTLNGSEPTATTGLVYAAPLNIAQTTVIRAAAFKTGFEPTNVDTETYLFLDDVITQSPTGAPPAGWPSSSGTSQVLDYGMDPAIVNNSNPNLGGTQVVKNSLASISAVSLVTALPNLFNISGSQGIYSNPGNRGFAWERPCSLEWINPPDAQNPNGTSEFQIDCGVRIRGGFSRSTDNPKHAFHFYFRSEHGEGKLKYPLFGRFGTDEFDQIDIRTAQNYSWSFQGDSRNTFIREESTRLAQLEMGQLSSHLRYVHLFINGQYWGLFNLEERTEAAFSASYLGGQKDDYDVVKAEQDSGYTIGATDGNLDAWQDLWTKSRAHAANPSNTNYFRMMGRAADGVTPTADPVLLDVDNLIDYMLLTFWTGNLDGATSNFLGNNKANNWFGSRRRDGTEGFRFFAHDFEHTFLSTSEDRTGPYPDANQNNFAYSNPMYLHMDLRANAEYRLRWADRVQKHMFNGG
ncbi:MAG: CotH kinase family protein, partial [Chthoniobacteraceae bacterium]